MWEVVDFDDIIRGLVDSLSTITVGGADRQPQFYWGQSDDLTEFLQAKREQHFPLVFSTTKEDEETAIEGIFLRQNAELNICTPETRRELLNTERSNLSYELTLKPLWEALRLAIEKSPYVVIRPGTLGFTKFPNHTVGGEFEGDVIWDVLRVRFDAEINVDFYCKSQK